ncbi:MAG: hypothetical protein KatS3mg038_3043 [Candidatus Kapaibacterium sp.]|nr:MAG: hypothetical protein KatS3mg038_3043 [Candidatus Kapabacteria bacterium]
MLSQHGQSLLVRWFRQVVTTTRSLLTTDSPVVPPEYLHRQLTSQFEQYDRQAMHIGGSFLDAYGEARYAMIAVADELLITTSWSYMQWWQEHLIEEAVQGTHVAGEDFFRRLERILSERRTSEYIEVAKVYLLALLLGFQGKYRGSQATATIASFISRLYEYIFDRPYVASSLAIAPSENLSLFSAGEIPYFAPSYRRYLLLASVLGVALIFSAILWLILTSPLRRLANEIEEIPAVMVTATEQKPHHTQPELSISLRTPLSGPVALHLYDAATGELLADTSIRTDVRLPVPAQRQLLLLSEAPLCFPLLDTIEASGAGTTIEHQLAFEKLSALVGKPIVLDNAHFEPGSAQLRADSMPWLDALARALAGDSTVSVTLYGYTDSQGSPQANLRLSRMRAEQVLTALLRGGVAYERLHAVGMGSQNPRASNITADGRARNRRVELVLSLR